MKVNNGIYSCFNPVCSHKPNAKAALAKVASLFVKPTIEVIYADKGTHTYRLSTQFYTTDLYFFADSGSLYSVRCSNETMQKHILYYLGWA